MGIIDVLNGMQNGPRGQRDTSSGSGGMSPITMAILGLLAYKAVKGLPARNRQLLRRIPAYRRAAPR